MPLGSPVGLAWPQVGLGRSWAPREGTCGLEQHSPRSSALLFSCSEAGEPPYITSAGFQFLLLDTASQLWYFTLQYLKTAQVRGAAAWLALPWRWVRKGWLLLI